MSISCKKCLCHFCTKDCSLRCAWCKDDDPLEKCFEYEGPELKDNE